MVSIIVGRLGKLDRRSVADGTTVGQLLMAEGITLQPEDQVRVRGRKIEDGHILQEGDVVLIVAPIVGERTISRGGIWRVYKNDPDTVFPSNFHAHHMEAPEVLDLYTQMPSGPRTPSMELITAPAMTLRRVTFSKSACQSYLTRWAPITSFVTLRSIMSWRRAWIRNSSSWPASFMLLRHATLAPEDRMTIPWQTFTITFAIGSTDQEDSKF